MFQRTRKPAFAIAFVGARFSFLQSSQICQNSELTRKILESLSDNLCQNCPTCRLILSSLKVEPSLSWQVCQAENSRREFIPSQSSQEVKVVQNRILSGKLDFLSEETFNEQKSLNKLIFCNLPWFPNLAPTVDAIACAGLDCSALSCQHKCM